MYLKTQVKIPTDRVGITRKTIKGTNYVYYAYGRKYDPTKKYTVPANTTIGKCDDATTDMMYPNENYLRFFPEIEMPDTKDPGVYRSGCLRIGSFIVLRKLIAECGLEEKLEEILGEDSRLFLDLAIYSIITEDNAGQHYPDYAFDHPLFTKDMHIYSDTKVSDMLNSITPDQSIAFQNVWTAAHDHREKIYISYDSTNKNCKAGDVDLVEFGHPKDDRNAPVINYSIVYDTMNSEPLCYEAYPGSIVDVSQLQCMIKKVNGYGYKNIGFILDRGYFSETNIHFMDKCGYDFVIMMKGMKDLVRDLVLEVKGTFEEDRRYSIRNHHVSGITVERQMYPSDESKRFFHIYYNDWNKSREHEEFESKIDEMKAVLKKNEGTEYKACGKYNQYFDIIYSHEGQPDQKFMYGRERYDVINEEIKLCGYFVIITSKRMTAQEALDLYKGRDASEKLFRGDKSYLGNKSYRTHKNESTRAKIFVEFVALIIRNRFHLKIRDHVIKIGKKKNYMNVSAAIKELEKIEIVRQTDNNYRMSYAVTSTQKQILEAFGITAANINEQAIAINDDLIRDNSRRDQ